ncbi:hypothetical protein PESHB4_11050 [Pediococcus ethanolidurans]
MQSKKVFLRLNKVSKSVLILEKSNHSSKVEALFFDSWKALSDFGAKIKYLDKVFEGKH